MEIVILDETRSRKKAIVDSLEKNRYKVVQCGTSNEFMNAVSNTSPGLFLVDVESWQHGRAIYSYFQIGRKLEHVPVVLYNAPEKFSTLGDRNRLEKDRILEKPTEIDSILDAVSHLL
jgi:DNA-binding NtrC family response regulator